MRISLLDRSKQGAFIALKVVRLEGDGLVGELLKYGVSGMVKLLHQQLW